MEPEVSLPHSQVPSTCPYLEPAGSTPYAISHFLKIHLNIIPIYVWVSQGLSFLQVSPPKPCIRLSLNRGTCPAHLILPDFITRKKLGEQYRSLSSSLCSFPHSLVNSSLLGPNILLNTLFSKPLILRSSLNVSNQVSNPYKTTRKIIFLYFLVFKFVDRKLEDKIFCTEW